MTKIVAFLRGINLGKRRIKMDDLRDAFDGMGLKNAQTLIASGNVLFEGEMTPELAAQIETGLKARFGFDVPTILRPMTRLRALADSDPFGGRTENDAFKLYVYFLARPEVDKINVPLAVPGVYEITRAQGEEIFIIGFRQPNGRYTEGMELVDRPFKRGVTNRNWNTILRMIEKAGG